MQYKEIQDTHCNITTLILKNEILSAIQKLIEFANKTGKEYLQTKIEKIKDTYSNILQYSFSGIKDPERDKIYHSVQRNLLEVLDSVKEIFLEETSGFSIYREKAILKTGISVNIDKVLSLINSLTYDDELGKILKDNKIEISSTPDENLVSREKALTELFTYFWLTDLYKEDENKVLDVFLNSKKIPWYDKSLMVSAITLSLTRYFDPGKFFALLKFYHMQEQQVWQRALVGIVLGLYRYDKRLNLYTDLKKEIKKLSEDNEINRQVEAILIQIFRSKDTEKITKQWEEEILPEMIKMQPKIEKNLDLENILSDEFMEDKNPDWQKVFEDSPDLLDKLQDFSQKQIEGSDVFMSAFSRLKHFPYFNSLNNWFSPFYKENEHVRDVLGNEKSDIGKFVEKLEKSHYMCNSDKYSFCLNLQLIPDEHKNMMMEMFNEEMKSMEEISKDENLLNSFALSKSIFTQYIQDLYRFFKVYPNKNEFSDIFKWDFNIQEFGLFNQLITDKQVTRNIAEFFLENEHYDRAAEVFINIEKSEKADIELFEKTGYCYQRTGDYKKALEYYQKAELVEADKLWIIKKIALCYRYLNKHEQALEYYKEAEKKEPENLYVLAYIGHTLMRLKKYEEALKYYFKVEYLAPSNEKIQRPIAWISFITSKFDTAIDYYNKLAVKNEFDLVNMGHTYWCSGDISNAIATYKEAVSYLKRNYSKFDSAFKENKKYLLENGIQDLDISLMRDMVLNSD